MKLRGRGAAAAALAAFLIGLAVPAPASAQALDPWWHKALEVDKNHQQATGKGVKIAVIDGALNADAPDLKGANITLRKGIRDGGDRNSLFPAKSYPTDLYAAHGTAMTTLIVGQGKGNAPGGAGIRGIAPDAEVYFYQMDPDPTDEEFEYPYNLFQQAIADKVDIISFSSTNATDLQPLIEEAQAAGIVVVAAGGSDGPIGEPASIPGVVAVGALDKNAKPWKEQPQGLGTLTISAPGVDIASGSMKGSRDNARWVSGTKASGTSPATALVAGALALVKQKYPAATGNQLIQQLIHNPGGRDYDWTRKDGFGVLSLGKMLATDPTGWPDVNPLLKGPDAARAEFPLSVYRDPGAPQPTTPPPSSPAPKPTEAPTSAAATHDAGSSSSALPWIGGGAVLAVAIVAGIIILRQRSRSSRQPVPTSSTRGN
jgi:subtilisin family serine protease